MIDTNDACEGAEWTGPRGAFFTLLEHYGVISRKVKKSSRSNTPVVVHPFMNSVHSHLYRYEIVCPCSDICKRKREIP